nr:RNA-directed DNA polymerase, eukaryota [Tanacetum cinerariifolium]
MLYADALTVTGFNVSSWFLVIMKSGFLDSRGSPKVITRKKGTSGVNLGSNSVNDVWEKVKDNWKSDVDAQNSIQSLIDHSYKYSWNDGVFKRKGKIVVETDVELRKYLYEVVAIMESLLLLSSSSSLLKHTFESSLSYKLKGIRKDGFQPVVRTPVTECFLKQSSVSQKCGSDRELDAWFSNFQEDDQDDLSSDGESQEGDVANKADNNESDVDRVSESSFMHENDTAHKDVNSCKKGDVGSHSEDPFNIYDLMDELVTVGQTMGYNMVGLGNKAKRRWIKELCQKHRINFASVQETKAESISLHTIKDLWGNQMFDHVVGSSVGCSRGILCMWNPNMFVKEQVSTCDYFVALMGTWAPTSSKLLNISVYAPQELNERRDLWDYLRTFIDRWEGDTVIMDDFNEVCSKHKRFGSTFNRQGAIVSNNFISSACLIDLPLEDRHLSDHRPILLRETNYDYGPFPFWFFHSWFAMEGFNYFVETTWKSLNIVEPNGLIRLKNKLQALKIAIKAWSKEASKRSNDRKINIQQNLLEVDKLIDQEKSNDEILIKRITLLNDLRELNNMNAMGISQKAKTDGPLKVMKTPNISMVKMAIWDCGTNKSPGLDGFSFEFYHDVVFIGEWNNNYIKTLLSVLRCFYLASGLKINLHKSKLMGIGVSSNVVTAAASLIRCSILTAPFNYLGVKDDSWLEEVALKVLYKRLYALEMCKSISVAEKMGNPSLSHSFRRMPRGGVEQKNYGLLCSKVADLVLPNISDRGCWSLEGSQEFSVKTSRILIDNTILPKAEVPTRWLRVVPIKAAMERWDMDYMVEVCGDERFAVGPVKMKLDEHFLYSD